MAGPSIRHCERSEASQRVARAALGGYVAPLLAMTIEGGAH